MWNGALEIDALAVVVVAANLLGGAMALPQALKLHADRRVQGISPIWAGVSATVNGWWAVYALGVGDLGILPVSVASVMAYLAIGSALVRFGTAPAMRPLAGMIGAGLAVAVVPVVALAVGGWPVAGITLGALYGVQLTPAVVAVHRSPDVSGVSTATWAMAFGEAALWGVYGFARLDVGLLALAATGVVMSGLVLVRLFVRRGRTTRPLGVATA